MKNVAGVRKELEFKTFFNILGPLVNPLQPKINYVEFTTLKSRGYMAMFLKTPKKIIPYCILWTDMMRFH